MKAIPYITICLTLVAVSIYYWAGSPSALVYQDGAYNPFTALSSHLVHWSGEHLFWDALSFLVVGSWCELIHRKGYGLFLFFAGLIIPPLAIAVTPSINCYAGFSGLDMGQAAFGISLLLHSTIKDHQWTYVGAISLLAAATLGKLLYEFFSHSTFFVSATQTDFIPVPAAHLLGVIVGIGTGFFVAMQYQPRSV